MCYDEFMHEDGAWSIKFTPKKKCRCKLVESLYDLQNIEIWNPLNLRSKQIMDFIMCIFFYKLDLSTCRYTQKERNIHVHKPLNNLYYSLWNIKNNNILPLFTF
jgi:hypothetical protein